jgi:hypothetical protein
MADYARFGYARPMSSTNRRGPSLRIIQLGLEPHRTRLLQELTALRLRQVDRPGGARSVHRHLLSSPLAARDLLHAGVG